MHRGVTVRCPRRGQHIVIARPVPFLQMADEQGRPAFAWRGDLPEHVGKQEGCAGKACRQQGQAVRGGQAVEGVETQPAGIRSPRQQVAGDGVRLQRDDLFEAFQEARRQSMAGIRADDYQGAGVWLPVTQPAGYGRMEAGPQAASVAEGAQLVRQATAGVEQMVAQGGEGVVHGPFSGARWRDYDWSAKACRCHAAVFVF